MFFWKIEGVCYLTIPKHTHKNLACVLFLRPIIYYNTYFFMPV
jgi:hypothetical protein